MRESRKSRIGGIAGAIGIAIVAFFLIFSLNSLEWPLASSLGKVVSVLPAPITVPDGVLLVTVHSNLTVIPTNSTTSLLDNPSFFPGYTTESLAGIKLGVFLGLSESVTNITNSFGQVRENLSPNTYAVKFFDWRLNNLSVAIQISSNKLTTLDISVNATSYSIQSANIVDPDFSGYAVSWGQIFLNVGTNASVTSGNPQTFLDTTYQTSTPISRMEQSGVTPITVGSSSEGNGSEWVQVQVNAPLNIGSIRSMSILTLRSEYNVTTNVIK